VANQLFLFRNCGGKWVACQQKLAASAADIHDRASMDWPLTAKDMANSTTTKVASLTPRAERKFRARPIEFIELFIWKALELLRESGAPWRLIN